MFDKVLQIGINYTGTDYALRGCINDVKNLNHFLRKYLKCGSNTQFRILTDDLKDPSLRPTCKNIVDGCKWLVEGAKAGDKLFIHYSGHGSWIRDASGDETDNRDETICPLDGQIVDDELKRLLVDTLPKDCELWGIFDCCHSGTGLDLKYTYRIDIKDGRVGYHIFPDGRYTESGGHVYLFSGCKDTQTSADAYIKDEVSKKNIWQGAMSWSFIKSWKAVSNLGTKAFKFTDFMKPLIQNLQQGGYSQLPQISTGKWLDLNKTMNLMPPK